MDSTNIINGTKPSLHKSRSNANFSHAAVHKTHVGEFQEGYFVMADAPPFPQQNRQPKLHKTPERSQQRKNDHRPHQQRERSTSTKDIEQLIRESEMHVSKVRLPTSPTRSPPRNNNRRNYHSPPQQSQQVTTQMNDQPLSPHKPRKAHHHEKNVVREQSFLLDTSGSPMKDKAPSLPPNRWAGPAFSNAPPPSSLPMPEFPPFQPLSSSPPSASLLSTSPPLSPGITTFAPIEQLYVPPPTMPFYSAYSVQLSYADPYAPQNLAQLSTDLRRMLNISQPISA